MNLHQGMKTELHLVFPYKGIGDEIEATRVQNLQSKLMYMYFQGVDDHHFPEYFYLVPTEHTLCTAAVFDSPYIDTGRGGDCIPSVMMSSSGAVSSLFTATTSSMDDFRAVSMVLTDDMPLPLQRSEVVNHDEQCV